MGAKLLSEVTAFEAPAWYLETVGNQRESRDALGAVKMMEHFPIPTYLTISKVTHSVVKQNPNATSKYPR